MRVGEDVTVIKVALKNGAKSDINTGLSSEGKLLDNINLRSQIRLDTGLKSSDILKISGPDNFNRFIIETRTSVYNLTHNKPMEGKETLSNLNEKMMLSAQYMERLDHFAEYISIDGETGLIEFSKPQIESVTNPKIQDYQNNFAILQRAFKLSNQNYIKKVKKAAGILDARCIMGAIIVTYDSSKSTPFSEESRGSYEHLSRDEYGEYLGLVHVDINPDKRKDGVTPSTSVTHEIQHHVVRILEYLMSKDPDLDLQFRKTSFRTMKEYKQPDNPYVNKYKAIEHDKEKLSLLLGREIKNYNCIEDIKHQGRYLDELHSSFLQRKSNWFIKNGNVYSVYKEGKHWEIVGDNPDDIESTKKLFIYIQGFFMCGQFQSVLEKKSGTITENQRKFIDDIKCRYRKVGSLIGISKTVKQAEKYLEGEWESLKLARSKFFVSNRWERCIKLYEEFEIAGDNIRSIL